MVEIFHEQTDGQISWQHGNLLPGTYSTAETPAQGYFVEGSIIPVGRFLAKSPSSMKVTSANYQSAILPDMLGVHLMKQDGTTYEDIIAEALNADENLEIVGVSAGHYCHSECARLYEAQICPPIGYLEEPLRWSFARPFTPNMNAADTISAVTNDWIVVYTETDMKPGDPILIRVEETVPYDKTSGLPPQLIGGVTNIEGGTLDIKDTRFANARIEAPAKAGSGVKIWLG